MVNRPPVVLMIDSNNERLMILDRLLTEKCEAKTLLAQNTQHAMGHLFRTACVDMVIFGDTECVNGHKIVAQHIKNTFWDPAHHIKTPVLVNATGDQKALRGVACCFSIERLIENLKNNKTGVNVLCDFLPTYETKPTTPNRQSLCQRFRTWMTKAAPCR
jgi:hypothetical protein